VRSGHLQISYEAMEIYERFVVNDIFPEREPSNLTFPIHGPIQAK
jgi:hypothetical protein